MGRAAVEALLGENWLGLLPAYGPLIIWGVIRSISSSANPVFSATGKPLVKAAMYSSATALLAIFIFPFTTSWGIAGAAWATVVAAMAYVLQYALVSRELKASWRDVVRPVFIPAALTAVDALGAHIDHRSVSPFAKSIAPLRLLPSGLSCTDSASWWRDATSTTCPCEFCPGSPGNKGKRRRNRRAGSKDAQCVASARPPGSGVEDRMNESQDGRQVPVSPNMEDDPIQGISFDPNGSLSIGDGEVRRRVTPDLFKTFRDFESSSTLDKLHGAGLVPTEVSSEVDHVLAHEFVPFVTYTQEWTLEMLRSAALCTLDVALVLSEAGYRLHDAHPWNVTFHHGQAWFLDFSSIRPGTTLTKGWVNEFFSTFYLPLWLRTKYLTKLSQMVAREGSPVGGVLGPSATGRQIFSRKHLGGLALRYHSLALGLAQKQQPTEALRRLRNHVSSMRLPGPKSEWGTYEAPGGAYDDLESYDEKALAVRSFFESLRPGRLIDIGCNRGWFSGLATSFGHDVLGIDVDENALNASWTSGTPTKLGFDLAHLSIMWPTPRQGLLAQQPSSFERWRSDTVMMISVAHHLVLRQKLGFEGIAAIPRAFGARNFIIEWVPAGDFHVRKWPKKLGVEIPEWYREDHFVETISSLYPKSQRTVAWSGPEGTSPEDRRILYLFQR